MQGEFRVLRNQGVGALEHRSSGAAVFGQRYEFRIRKMLLEKFECAARRTAKAVDALIGIADREHVPLGSSQFFEDLDLGKVRILKLVNQDETRAQTCTVKQGGVF